MTENLYRRLVKMIHDYRTWIDVLDADTETDLRLTIRGSIQVKHLPVLRLISKYRNYCYEKGHVWTVPRFELDRAVRRMSRRDPRFRQRMENLAPTLADVEAIVQRATYGFVNLELEP